MPSQIFGRNSSPLQDQGALNFMGEGIDEEYGQHFFQYSSKVTIPAGGKISDEIKIQADSYFDLQKMYATDNGDVKGFSISIRDTYLNYSWSSAPVRRNNIFGTPQYPAICMDPILLPPVVSLLIDYQDLSGIENPVEVVFEGARRYTGTAKAPSEEEVAARSRKRWFQYVFDSAIPASDQIMSSMQINADSFFMTKKLMAQVKDLASIRMAVSTLGNRNLSDRFISFDNLFGTAVRPNILPKNQRIPLPPLSIVQFELKDNSGALNDLQIVFEGVKAWKRG